MKMVNITLNTSNVSLFEERDWIRVKCTSLETLAPSRKYTVLFADCEGCLSVSLLNAMFRGHGIRAVLYEKDGDYTAVGVALTSLGFKVVGHRRTSHMRLWIHGHDLPADFGLMSTRFKLDLMLQTFGGTYWLMVLLLAWLLVGGFGFVVIPLEAQPRWCYLCVLSGSGVILLAFITLASARGASPFWTGSLLMVNMALLPAACSLSSSRRLHLTAALLLSFACTEGVIPWVCCLNAALDFARDHSGSPCRDWEGNTVPSPSLGRTLLAMFSLNACGLAICIVMQLRRGVGKIG